MKNVLLVTIVLGAIVVACSPRGVDPARSTLDDAVGLYIAGDYQGAIDLLAPLTAQLESEEDVLTAYLYLGRSYEALGDYAGAADAYSSGRILGGGVRFEEHLAFVQGHLRSSPRNIRAQNGVTRAQLAAMLVRLGGLEESATPAQASDLSGHWAERYAATVVELGIMDVLPDGRFHPDEVVSAAAFYMVLNRAQGTLGVPPEVVETYFPRGLSGVLAGGDAVISGAQATDILQAVLARAGG